MNPADQIHAITRRSCDHLVAAAGRHSASSAALREQLLRSHAEAEASEQTSTPPAGSTTAHLAGRRRDLAAAMSQETLPTLMLPADIADVSPHHRHGHGGGPRETRAGH